MRFAFPLIVLALAAALGWLFLATEADSTRPLDASLPADEAPPVQDQGVAPDLGARSLEDVPAGDGTQDLGTAALAAGDEPIRWDELLVLGQLVSAKGAPLPNYTVLVAPTGQKPHQAGTIPLAQRSITDAKGHCAFRGLDVPGPWEVYAFPKDLGAVRRTLDAKARVGTVTAKNPKDAERTRFTVKTGARVILRSALPAGVKAEDLWFEAVPSINATAASAQIAARQGYTKPNRTVHRFAQGTLSEDGFVVAQLPADPMLVIGGGGFAVHARTLDGRFGLVAAREEYLAQQTDVVLDERLERRGRVAIRLIVGASGSNESGGSLDEEDWLRAVEVVDWQLLQDDPARNGPKLPSSLHTTFQNRSWVRTGPGTFEVGDLPLGIALEIGDLGDTRSPRAGPKVRFRRPGPNQPVFVPTNLVRATPVHGEPELVEVRIRREG